MTSRYALGVLVLLQVQWFVCVLVSLGVTLQAALAVAALTGGISAEITRRLIFRSDDGPDDPGNSIGGGGVPPLPPTGLGIAQVPTMIDGLTSVRLGPISTSGGIA